MYEMRDDYYINFPQIDDEHAYLFSLAEKTYQLLIKANVPDKYAQIKDIINELRDYTSYHFTHEEEYMTSINYKRLPTQKIQHRVFVKMLTDIDIDEMVQNKQDEAIEDLLRIFTDWLKYHIWDNDRLIVQDP